MEEHVTPATHILGELVAYLLAVAVILSGAVLAIWYGIRRPR